MSTENRNTNYPKPQPTAETLRDVPMVRGRTPDDDPSPEQIELLREMTGQQRFALAETMFWEARELKAAGVRHQHPDWSAEQVTAEVSRIFLNACH